MDEKIIITFPNEGESEISRSIIENWDIEITNTIGNTIFFSVGGNVFSIEVDEYNKLKNASKTKKIQSK